MPFDGSNEEVLKRFFEKIVRLVTILLPKKWNKLWKKNSLHISVVSVSHIPVVSVSHIPVESVWRISPKRGS
jgi:hypothetical protein